MILAIIVIGYLGGGLIALAILDMATHRIQQRLKDASYQTQSTLAASGNPVGTKAAFVVIILALWMLWPAALYGALESHIKDGKS
jgi:hypothetical protein